MITQHLHGFKCFYYTISLRAPSNIPGEVENPPETQDGTFVGYVGEYDPPQVGFMLLTTFHGKGYATEALRAFLDIYWSRETCGAGGLSGRDYVEAEVQGENIASQRVCEKCGFELWRRESGAFVSPLMGEGEKLVYRLSKPGVHRGLGDQGSGSCAG